MSGGPSSEGTNGMLQLVGEKLDLGNNRPVQVDRRKEPCFWPVDIANMLKREEIHERNQPGFRDAGETRVAAKLFNKKLQVSTGAGTAQKRCGAFEAGQVVLKELPEGIRRGEGMLVKHRRWLHFVSRSLWTGSSAIQFRPSARVPSETSYSFVPPSRLPAVSPR